MIKRLISPFQKALLRRKLCVACTHPLEKAKLLGELNEKRDLYQCKCHRLYVLEKDLGSFRRASLEEEQEYLNKKKNIK